jgi:hypothetical protein
VRLFVENLTVNKCYLASDHVTNYLWAGDTAVYRGITGDLPEDKKTMLQMVDKAIEFVESTEEEVKDSNRLYEEGYFTAL